MNILTEKREFKNPVYDQIDGWFRFGDIYNFVLNRAQISRGAGKFHFVEIGVFMGKSISYLAFEAYNRRIDFRIDGIDKFDWEISKEYSMQEFGHDLYCGMVEKYYDENAERFGFGKFVNKIKSTSLDAVKNYKDESLDLVFIDGDHSPEGVRADILAWYPKVKSGGIFAGDDYINGKYPESVIVMDETFKELGILDKVQRAGYCSWMMVK